MTRRAATQGDQATTGAWIARVGIDMVNMNLHIEHGNIATVLPGVWLCRVSR